MPKSLSELSKAITESPLTESQSAVIGAREQAEMMARIQCDMAREVLEGLIQDRGERKIYADKSFKLVCWWIAGMFVILIFEGFLTQAPTITFKLPDSVLLAVVGGTTVSVISIFIVVANYLFPKR